MKTSIASFLDELQKIAAAREPKDDMGDPARKANAFFGLPLVPPKRGVRAYELGSAAAQTPDRSQAPIDGQSTANVAGSNTLSPAAGPGGV